MGWRLGCLAAISLAAAGCGDDTPDDGPSGTSASGGSSATGGAGGAGAAGGTSAMGGSGGSVVDRCPEVCAKLDALFASFGAGCMVEQCNCKPACADLFEASIDCIPPGSASCTCNGNELDCSGLCEAESQAANDCWQAN